MKYIIALALCICTPSMLFAQKYLDMISNSNVNYYDVIQEAEKYFDTIDTKQKGTGYKNYLRWKYNNASKYEPTGERNLVSDLFAQEQYHTFLSKYPHKKTRSILNEWKELGPSTIDSITGHYAAGLGRIEDVYIHKANTNIIYLGSRSGGFWKTTNGGSSWLNTTDTLFASGVNTITASATNADSILINCRNADNGTSHGIYRSIDGGNTWTLTNFQPATLGTGGLGTNFKINKLFYHPTVPNLVFIGTNQGLYRSADNLQTWNQIYPAASITFIEFHPTDANIMYIYDDASASAFSNQVLVSTNMGVSFTPSATLTGNSGSTLFLSTSNQCPNCLYAGSNNGIWRSVDSGKTFTFLTNPAQSCRAFAVHTSDTSKMIAGYVDLENSTNGGQSFSQRTWWSLGSSQHNGSNNQESFNVSSVYIHADVNILKCVNGVYYAGSDGYVSKSNDNGVSWQRISEGTGIREYYKLGTSQSNHYVTMVGSQDNGESIVNQKGWIEFYGADGMEGFVHPLNENWITGSVQYGSRRRTKDGGLSQNGISPSVDDGAWEAPFAYSPRNPMQIFDFTDSVMRSDDFGSNWQYVGKPSFSNNISAAAIAENNSNIIVVSSGSSLQKSIDGGVSFVNIKNNLPSFTITDIAFDPRNDDIIVVTYNRYQNENYKVYITFNGGTNWTNITYNLGSMPLHCAVIDHTPQRNIYVGAEIGVFVKAMNDTTWTLYNENLPNVTVQELEINYGSNTLKAATWGRGLWENSLRNRKDFPAIVHTGITNPPTDQFPKVNFNQTVKSRISYVGTLSQVWVAWGLDTTLLSNIILMTNTSDSTWTSNSAIPSMAKNTHIYFKVFAVGSSNDTSETYRFMYKILPGEHCQAAGTLDGGNLFISNVKISSIDNTTLNDSISYYNTPILDLFSNTTYTLTITANTTWNDNDFGAWIDFNGDQFFDKTSETVLFKPNNNGTANATFSLPTAYYGFDTVRMRIRLSYWGADPDPCGITMGEVEDYAVKLNYPLNLQTINKQTFTLYPNPVDELLYIQGEQLQLGTLKLLNTLGQTIDTKDILTQSSANTFQLNVKKLKKGVYYIRIQDKTMKFIKE